MTVGTTGFADIDQRERAALAEQQHESQNVGWMEHGFGVLGLVQLARKDASGLHVEHVWVQRGQDQTGNLPTAVVERARTALASEQSARAAYNARRDEALAYIAKHGLSSQAGQVHLELHCAEAWTAFQATQKPTRLAMRDLGQIAEEAAQIRAVINASPAKRRQIEATYQTQLAQLDAEVQAARLRAAQLGIS